MPLRPSAHRSVAACAASLAVLSATAATASATTLRALGGGRPPVIYSRWLHAAAMPTPPGVIVLDLAGCPAAPQLDGCSIQGEIWLRSGAGRAAFLHELGHQFDYHQPAAYRAGFERINHDHPSWDAGPDAPAEQFAEAWTACAWPPYAKASYDPASGRYQLAYGYWPTPAPLHHACRLIAHTTLTP